MDKLKAIFNTRFLNRHGASLAWAMSGLVVLLVLFYIGWSSYTQAQIRNSNYQPQSLPPIAGKANKGYRVNDIVAANLFGNPAPKPVPKEAPKTTLNLKLEGILSASDQNIARAIISAKNKAARLYAVGDRIQGANASIKEIRDLEVLLLRSGATESLPLLKSKSSGNRSIITFEDVPPADDGNAIPDSAANPSDDSQQFAAEERSRQFSAANRSTAQRSRGETGSNRKVRKPNLSSLDRTLRKQGEL